MKQIKYIDKLNQLLSDPLEDKALVSMRDMQAKSKSMGNDKMSLKEINKVIKKARNK